MKILIIGASGLLGTKLFEVLSKHNEVVGTYFSKKTAKCNYLDITKKPSVEMFFNKTEPDVIVHAAAIPDADYCEENRNITKKIHVDGTKHIAEACKKNNCKLVYISSDYIFDGEHGPYKEDSKPNPVNYYGVTKLEGEEIVQKNSDDYIIARPAILYGYHNSKSSFVAQTLDKLQNKEKIFADNKIIKYPTLTDDVSWAVDKLIRNNAKGIFHTAGNEPVTRYQWAVKIARAYELPTDNIFEEESKYKAKRPLDVKLNTAKIAGLGIKFVGVDEGIKIMKNQGGCMFRMIYSVRPDMLVLNQSASQFRIDVGKKLAKEHPANADIVIPVPESGIYGATGYAAESKIPFYFGLIRDYYTQKTLFEPAQVTRNAALKKKLIVVPEVIRNKRIVLVDEAILSGSTLNAAIEKIKKVGVKEIHVRIPSPPMTSNCNNKILDPNANLIAKKFKGKKESIEKELKKHFGVDSLYFLSLEGFLGVLSLRSKACIECFKE